MRALNVTLPSLIVVIGSQRSGTTVYRQLLVSAGALDDGEIAHAGFLNSPNRFYWFVYQKVKQEPRFIHPLHQKSLFSEFLTERRTRTKQPLLIDLKYNALRLLDFGRIGDSIPAVIGLLKNEKAKFTHVIRRNKLRVIVSNLIAMRTNQWGLTTEQDLALSVRRVRLDPGAIVREINKDLRVTALVSKYIPEAIEVEYEAMFDPDGQFSTSMVSSVALLGLSAADINKVRLRKQNPEPLSELIENYADVAMALKGTPHEWMLT